MRAKGFLGRQGASLQDSLRDFIEVAADCEQGLKLHEEDTSISEMQVALAAFVQILRLYHSQMQGRMVSEQPSSGTGDVDSIT